MKRLLPLFLVFTCLSVLGQTDSLITVRGGVLETETSLPCPYARVVCSDLSRSVLCDDSGRFQLSVHPIDTLRFEYLGFKSVSFTADEVPDTIFLITIANLLDEITVVPQDALVYRLLAGVYPARNSAPLTARTYFQLETKINDVQTELVESYYNGHFKNYGVRSLDFKTGRISLRKNRNTSFVSLETSKAILQFQLNERSDLMPETPFAYAEKKMRKHFRVQLEKKIQIGNDLMYIVSFEPRDSLTGFSGTAWIDSATNNLYKLNLKAHNTSRYPFDPIFPGDTIREMNFDITFHFRKQETEKSTVITTDYLYFDYSLVYHNRDQERYTVQSKALLSPYDYGSSFTMPFFNAHILRYSDYRRINSVPYNALFWEKNARPVSVENSVANDSFFQDSVNLMLTATRMVMPDQKPFFESPFLIWSKQRIGFLGRHAKDTVVNDFRSVQPTINQYTIGVHLFADVNEFADTTQLVTASVLDPFETFYNLPLDTLADCFLNICFDIVEIERRNLEQAANELPKRDLEQLKILIENANKTVEQRLFAFQKEVDHGTNRAALEKWNTIILKELGIDNMLYFGLKDQTN